MSSTLSLDGVNLSLQDGQFSLIQIPLSLYSTLFQPILQVLLPHQLPSTLSTNGDSADSLFGSLSIHDKHGFLNISITPIECSIVCHTHHATTIFQPAITLLPKDSQKLVSISKDSYLVFSVSSAGMEAGQRVMDLTAPLAMAGIPIFFITTYYTDFILVPSKDHQSVVYTLLARGFEFSESDSTYVAPQPTHSRAPSSASDPPSTPPPSNVAELQTRTFKLLQKRNVVPFIHPDLFLVQCSGRDLSNSDHRPSSNGLQSSHSAYPPKCHWTDTLDPKLYLGLVAALALPPTFLSLTLSASDAPSLLLDKNLLPLFGDSLAGDTEGDLVPVFLNLETLPLESTGIVCGVAGRLVEELRMEGGGGSELSYLSTARAGAVVLSRSVAGRAVEALGPLLKKEI